MNKAVFLDRDGVINPAVIVGNEAFSPRKFIDFKILPDVKEAIVLLKKKKYHVIVVTNQPEIPRGLLELSELEKMHDYLSRELKVDDIFVCLHDDVHNCDCRKPKPGLFLQAQKKWKIDFDKSYLVGDRWRDIEAGRAVGCKTVLIKNPASGECLPNYVVNSLYEVVVVVS